LAPGETVTCVYVNEPGVVLQPAVLQPAVPDAGDASPPSPKILERTELPRTGPRTDLSSLVASGAALVLGGLGLAAGARVGTRRRRL
ncbi:MAG: hypothetical protein ACRDV9_06200, partial [Acidimicrobiia bacterium]